MDATYISTTSFSVVGDRTADFVINIRIRGWCGVDDYQYANVVSATYSSVTTVVIDDAVLTANLVNIDISVVVPGGAGNISDHDHGVDSGSGGPVAGIGSAMTPTDVTISGGVITVTGAGVYNVDTEGAAASDALDQILGLTDGEEVELRAKDDTHTVVVTPGTHIKSLAVFSLDSIYDRMLLQSVGSDTVIEKGRVNSA